MGEEHLKPPRPNDATGSPADATSAAGDPCGCLARLDREPSPAPEPDESAESQPEPGASTENSPDAQQPEGPRRALKLVLHLQPTGAAGYRAMLALGADGCDPLLRAAEVADLAAALDEIPGLVAEAEARWQAQPRYPATSPKARTGATPSRAKATPPAPVASEATEAAADASTAKPSAEPSAKPASAGQLSLFGQG